MTRSGITPDPSAIQVIPKAPFVRLPDPEQLFAKRAARFRRLAEASELGPYLQFLGSVADAQASVQTGLDAPEAPAPEAVERATRHSMPPIDRTGFVPDAALHELLERLIVAAASIEMPPAAADALAQLREADTVARNQMIRNVLMDAIPFEEVAGHALVAAALQVHFARLAAELDPAALKPVADGVCPCCGGAPSVSLVVNWPNAEGSRYCACSLCGTCWNYVRAKCTLCGETKDITFREVDGAGGTIKAEVCGSCQGYVKVLYQQKQPALDPIADDVASLALDLLVREQGFRRGAVNPFLTGY